MTGPGSRQEIPLTNTGSTFASRPDAAVLSSLFIAALLGIYLLLTSTTNLIPGIWPYDAKRILQFALLLVLFLFPALNRRIRDETGQLLSAVSIRIKIAVLAVFSWGVVSVLINAQNLMQALNSFSEVALLSVLVLGVFVVAACRRIAGRSFDRLAIGLIALTGLAVGLQELIGVVAAHNAGVDFNFRISLLHFSWPRFYNQVQSWTIPALAALPLLFARNRLAIFLCALVLGLQWYIILATGARGSFVSIGAATALALVFLPAVRWRLFAWQASGLAAGALIFALVMFSFEKSDPGVAALRNGGPGRSPAVSDTSGDAIGRKAPAGENSFFTQSLGKPMVQTSGRTEMWRMTVEDIRQHPFTGIGPMNYVCVSEKPIGHPHNFPLQLASEWGLPVAVVLGGVLCLLWWRTGTSVRQNRFGGPEDNIFAGLLLTGLTAAALHACLSGVMVMPASQVTGLLICGMLLGLYPFAPPGGAPKPAFPGLFSALVLSIFLLGLGAHELSTMQARSKLLEAKDILWPRMWQDAKVCRLYNKQIEVKN